MEIKDHQKYSDLIKRLDNALSGEEIDDVIPALVSFTVLAGCLGQINKRMLLSFFVDSLDRTYSEFDERKTDEKNHSQGRDRNGTQ